MTKDTWDINVIYIFLVIKIQANTLITKTDINSSYMLTLSLFSHQYCGSTFLIKLTPLTGDLFIKNKSSTSLLGELV